MRTGEFEDLCGKVFKHSGCIHGRLSANTHVVLRSDLEVTVNTAYRELDQGLGNA
jgi:hypothetical protein